MEGLQLQNLNKYPVLKHYDDNQFVGMETENQSPTRPVFSIVKLVLLGAGLYLSWDYILIPLFIALGQIAIAIATIIAVVGMIIMAPLILRWLKDMAIGLEKVFISQKPFDRLALERENMVKHGQEVTKTKILIQGLEMDGAKASKGYEDKALSLQSKMLKDEKTADSMNEILKKLKQQPDYETSDEFIHHNAAFFRLVSDTQRTKLELEHCKTLISSYGVNYRTMKMVRQKLFLAEIAHEAKLMDFDVTVDMLKREYTLANATKQGTTAARKALGLDPSWQLEFATNVITKTIANDIAITAGNLKDIGKITSEYSLDSEELYAKLKISAESIKVKADVVPSAKAYQKESYILTEKDRLSSGFSSLLD